MSQITEDGTFGRKYRLVYSASGELALIRHGSKDAVEARVQECVTAISQTLDEEDVHIAFLSLAHVIERHFLDAMAGR